MNALDASDLNSSTMHHAPVPVLHSSSNQVRKMLNHIVKSLNTFSVLVIILFFKFPTCATDTTSTTMHFGSCPIVNTMENFDLNRFIGEWYVYKQSSAPQSCLKYNFLNDANDELKMETSRQYSLMNWLGMPNIYTYTGSISLQNPNDTGRLTVTFPLNLYGGAEVIVFMTDYDSYAGLYTCQNILWGHARSVSILTRNKITNNFSQRELSIFNEKIGDELIRRTSLSLEDFYTVDQSYCATSRQAWHNFVMDDSIISFDSLGRSLKTVLSSVGGFLQQVDSTRTFRSDYYNGGDANGNSLILRMLSDFAINSIRSRGQRELYSRYPNHLPNNGYFKRTAPVSSYNDRPHHYHYPRRT